MAVDTRVHDRRFILRGAGAAAAASLVRLDPVLAVQAEPLVLAAGAGRLGLLPRTETAVLAFNGQVPGPLLRLKLGGSVDVRLANALDRPTTISWQGVRLPEAMDGVAGLTQPAVEPGRSFSYRFTPPDAGLYWYRPNVWPDGAAQVAGGLYGVLLVDEAAPPPVDLDLLVVIDDWMLGAEGQLLPQAPLRAADGGRPATALLTANSKPLPMVQEARPGARVRLRLLNVCGTRLALVGCSGMAATVIAVDGQPSELFEPARGTVPIGPGSRFELILDLPRAVSSGDGGAAALVRLTMEDLPEQVLLRFAVKGEALPPRGAVPKLPDNPLLPTRIHLESSLKRDLLIAEAGAMPAKPAKSPGRREARKPRANRTGAHPAGSHPAAPPSGGSDAPNLSTSPKPSSSTSPGASAPLNALAWTMAGKPVDGLSGRPLFAVKRGSPVTLAFINQSAFAQQAHVHGHVFRVLHDLDDGWDPYWRDSVLVGPGRTKHVAFVADNPGRWMVEAVALDHPGPSLAAYFTVEA